MTSSHKSAFPPSVQDSIHLPCLRIWPKLSPQSSSSLCHHPLSSYPAKPVCPDCEIKGAPSPEPSKHLFSCTFDTELTVSKPKEFLAQGLHW